jgi:hypothetical protein
MLSAGIGITRNDDGHFEITLVISGRPPLREGGACVSKLMPYVNYFIMRSSVRVARFAL